MDILLVEDDAVDTESFRRILRKADVTGRFFSASDGVEALGLLRGARGGEGPEQPCLIFVDLNMPRMNGFELLGELQQDEVLRRNIAFILTTSNREEDKATAYDLRAAGYILKENMRELAAMITHYTRINERPGVERQAPFPGE